MIEAICITLAVLAALFVLYLLAVGGRSGHPGLAALRSHVYAHRGLHNEERPENSLTAFKAAKEKGYGVELDVHLLKDGTLAVFHDHTLIRMTGKEGKIEDLTAAELSEYTLADSGQTIPTLEQVLELLEGGAPLVVELKAAGNHRALVHATMAVLKRYNVTYCIESFDPRCLWYLRRDFPNVIRGQLSQNFFKSNEKLSGITKFMLTYLLTNFLTRPDFVAYHFAHRHELSVRVARKIWGVQGVVWTLTDSKQHQAALSEGFLPIFEQYEP